MKEKKLTYPEIPEGLAPFYVYGPTQTACLLCKARGPHSNKLPDSLDHLEIVASGVAFMKMGDEYSVEHGEVVSLGRALKAHRKLYSGVQFVAKMDIPSMSWVTLSR